MLPGVAAARRAVVHSIGHFYRSRWFWTNRSLGMQHFYDSFGISDLRRRDALKLFGLNDDELLSDLRITELGVLRRSWLSPGASWLPASWALVVLHQLQHKEDAYRAAHPSWMDQAEAPVDIRKQWRS